MKHIANTKSRRYRSDLRAEQADETRNRILEATLRVMARGIASLSVPAIAHEARVSVPTVYRHFGSKQELLAALYPYGEQRAGLRELVLPTRIADLRQGVRALLDHLDAFDDLTRAAMASPAAAEARALSMPRRLGMTRAMADTAVPPLRPADRDRLARLLVILTSSGALRTWRDQLGVSVDTAADDIDWVVQSVVAAAGAAA